MTQEVRVMLQLTLDVDIAYSKEKIGKRIEHVLNNYKLDFPEHMVVQMVDVIEIKEEAEIYETEEENLGLQEYIKKYHVDTKRQTKLDL